MERIYQVFFLLCESFFVNLSYNNVAKHLECQLYDRWITNDSMVIWSWIQWVYEISWDVEQKL